MAAERYRRNIGTITEEENELLGLKKVCVVGCGGLGGYVIESLGRIGVGHITAVDFDVFEESNLNRQITSEVPLLGTSKAEAAMRRMKRVNPLITVLPVVEKLTESNADDILGGHDVIVDAVDSLAVRRLLQDAAERLGIPLVHGAIGGWYGQVCVILPGDRTLDRLYNPDTKKGVEAVMGTPGFTPAVIGSIEACETVKLLIGRGRPLRNRVLNVDLLYDEFILLESKPQKTDKIKE
jgi:molybdopterin/thiamine biosynthesis adenylyltransferase